MSKDETREFVKSMMGGYTDEELDAAWDEVKNQKDWKAGVDREVYDKTDEELARIVYAVGFYTSTQAVLEELPAAEGWHSRRTRVRAVGYRMGPAGDH